MVSSIDELRARFPRFGFALYAMTPGGAMTLEVHDTDSGEVFAFEGPSFTACAARAFPDLGTTLADAITQAKAETPPGLFD